MVETNAQFAQRMKLNRLGYECDECGSKTMAGRMGGHPCRGVPSAKAGDVTWQAWECTDAKKLCRMCDQCETCSLHTQLVNEEVEKVRNQQQAEGWAIASIAERARTMIPDDAGISTRDIREAIQEAHDDKPLRLADLAEGTDNDIAHDALGIMRHIDHGTGCLGLFLPRFAVSP